MLKLHMQQNATAVTRCVHPQWDAPCLLIRLSLDIVVSVGVTFATYQAAEEETAAAHHKQAQQDVDQSGGPEGKQVDGLIAVGVHICCIFVVVGLINRVDPHITSNKPAEEEARCQRVPGHADLTEWVGGAVFVLLGAGQAGEQRQHQAKSSGHYQIDGDVGLPRTVIQV